MGGYTGDTGNWFHHKGGTSFANLEDGGFGATKGTVMFGATAVTGANILAWEDTQVRVLVPAVAAGIYAVSVKNAGGVASGAYSAFEILSGPQVSVRFVVNNAATVPGENIYLAGDKFELTGWSAAAPIGPLFNQVMYSYPTWYTDVSVPASSTVNFKFLKKSANPTVWEGGSNHGFVTPARGTATVNVNWQP
ncbi:MAG: carbohydrate-binding module family 20 domain-containing protein [Telluria sp.]